MVTWIAGDKITAAKLNAMQSDFVSNIEGDYTSWKYVWTEDYSATIADAAVLFSVSNTGTVTFSELNDQTVLYKKTYAGVKSSTACYAPYVATLVNDTKTSQSVLGTYYAIKSTTGSVSFKIFKNDVVIQTITITDDDATLDFVTPPIFVSPNGRYIAAVVSVALGDNDEAIILYEADV